MHNREDEQVALDAKCPDTVEMFEVLHWFVKKDAARADKSISDDFPKQIDQREEVIPDD